jgi:hypothetical protein
MAWFLLFKFRIGTTELELFNMGHARNIWVIVIGIISLFPSLCPAASLLVAWKANADTDLGGYKVYYGTKSGTYETVADVQKATSYQISNVQNGFTYYVVVSSYDNSGNESIHSPEISAYVPVPVVVTADTTPPTGSVVINEGASTTTSSEVTLTLSASDAGGTVTGMKISNDGVSYSTEFVNTSSCTWTLSSGYGNKTVYVLFKDSAGNWMKSPATYTIQVTTPPTPPPSAGSVVINSGVASIAIVTPSASDAGGAGSVTTEDQSGPSLIKPVIISPENNAVNVPLRPVLKTTDLANNYRLTEWEISNDKGDVLLDIKSATQRTELVVPEMILDAAMKHYCRVKFYDDQNNATEWSDPVAFETVQIDPSDLNKNGIPDDQELLSSEDVDLDKDGVPDRNQANMKALVTSAGEYISLKMSTNCKAIKSIKSSDPTSIFDTAGKPEDLPIGLIDFKVEVVNSGEYAEVVINLSEPAPQDAKWYMYDDTNGWRVYPHAAFSDDRMKVTLQLKDGDPDYGDTDGVANGIIVDPGGLGAGEIQQANAERRSSSGCFIDTSRHHPSSQGMWAAILLILLLVSSIDRYRKKIVL